MTVNGTNYRFRVESPQEGDAGGPPDHRGEGHGACPGHPGYPAVCGGEYGDPVRDERVESEEKVAAAYGWEHMLYSYMKIPVELKNGAYDFDPDGGFVAFGEKKNEVLSERVQAVKAVFDRCHIPYRIDLDMELGLWQKFMSNIGRTWTCALLGVPFKALAESEHARASREWECGRCRRWPESWESASPTRWAEAAMNRPITAPYNRPSTLQDLDAKKRTEIDMFAGTVVRLGRKLGWRPRSTSCSTTESGCWRRKMRGNTAREHLKNN